MSVYLVKRKGWRYDFTLEGERHTGGCFRTKREAKAAERRRRREAMFPAPQPEIPIDMGFLDLVNRRLDYVEAYHSRCHYLDCRSLAAGWVRRWGNLAVSQITQEMVQEYVLERRRVSNTTANKEIRSLRAAFNFAKKRKWLLRNPTDGIEFLPEQRKVRRLPSLQDIEAVLRVADEDARDYLLTIRETLARVGEVNQLTWDDVSLEGRYLFLHTRKKKGGHRTPRKIPMTGLLHEILSRRHGNRSPGIPWVFWHRYYSRKKGAWMCGPFQRRKRLMEGLCRKAGVGTFQFHALRHFGASLMDRNAARLGSIQRILGHESRRTTEIYLHSLGDSEREAIEIFERALQGNGGLCNAESHTDSHTSSEEPEIGLTSGVSKLLERKE